MKKYFLLKALLLLGVFVFGVASNNSLGTKENTEDLLNVAGDDVDYNQNFGNNENSSSVGDTEENEKKKASGIGDSFQFRKIARKSVDFLKDTSEKAYRKLKDINSTPQGRLKTGLATFGVTSSIAAPFIIKMLAESGRVRGESLDTDEQNQEFKTDGTMNGSVCEDRLNIFGGNIVTMGTLVATIIAIIEFVIIILLICCLKKNENNITNIGREARHFIDNNQKKSLISNIEIKEKIYSKEDLEKIIKGLKEDKNYKDNVEKFLNELNDDGLVNTSKLVSAFDEDTKKKFAFVLDKYPTSVAPILNKVKKPENLVLVFKKVRRSFYFYNLLLKVNGKESEGFSEEKIEALAKLLDEISDEKSADAFAQLIGWHDTAFGIGEFLTFKSENLSDHVNVISITHLLLKNYDATMPWLSSRMFSGKCYFGKEHMCFSENFLRLFNFADNESIIGLSTSLYSKDSFEGFIKFLENENFDNNVAGNLVSLEKTLGAPPVLGRLFENLKDANNGECAGAINLIKHIKGDDLAEKFTKTIFYLSAAYGDFKKIFTLFLDTNVLNGFLRILQKLDVVQQFKGLAKILFFEKGDNDKVKVEKIGILLNSENIFNVFSLILKKFENNDASAEGFVCLLEKFGNFDANEYAIPHFVKMLNGLGNNEIAVSRFVSIFGKGEEVINTLFKKLKMDYFNEGDFVYRLKTRYFNTIENFIRDNMS